MRSEIQALVDANADVQSKLTALTNAVNNLPATPGTGDTLGDDDKAALADLGTSLTNTSAAIESLTAKVTGFENPAPAAPIEPAPEPKTEEPSAQ